MSEAGQLFKTFPSRWTCPRTAAFSKNRETPQAQWSIFLLYFFYKIENLM